MKPIPFEVIHPQEASYLQWLYQLGFAIRWDVPVPYIPIRCRLKKARRKYDADIQRIRQLPDIDLSAALAQLSQEGETKP